MEIKILKKTVIMQCRVKQQCFSTFFYLRSTHLLMEQFGGTLSLIYKQMDVNFRNRWHSYSF